MERFTLSRSRGKFEEALNSFKDKLNSDIIDIEKLRSTESYRLSRESFQITIADGRTFKIRCFPTQQWAETFQKLSQYLESPNFPKIVTTHENVSLIQWLNARPIRLADVSDDLYRNIGNIHAKLHNTHLPDQVTGNIHASIQVWFARLKRKLGYLVQEGLLTGEDREKLLEVATIRSTSLLEIGLVHGNFCLENMLIDQDGNLFVIDNETISISAIAYDLARTIYTSHMNRRQRELYLESYEENRNSDDFLRNYVFWLVYAIVESAVLQHRGRMDYEKQPFSMIQRVLEDENYLFDFS